VVSMAVAQWLERQAVNLVVVSSNLTGHMHHEIIKGRRIVVNEKGDTNDAYCR
jgi:hypothetical protein